MSRTHPQSIHRFADLSELYAQMTATPEFRAAFGEPLELSIVEAGEPASDAEMPDPLAAQADCGGVIACIFDLLTDTRLEPFAAEIAWGFVNSFHFAAGKLERREDMLTSDLRELVRTPDMSEVYTRELEDKQLECQSVAEQRAAIETMRDFAAETYHALSGWPWSPARGSRTSAHSASQIDALDFLRARTLAARERHSPQGPVVVFSGPSVWHDHAAIFERLDAIHARIPSMTLVTTGQRSGADAIAAGWAARKDIKVPLVSFRLYGSGMKKAFDRNRKLLDLGPVEAVLCEGSGVQANLYQMLRKAGVPIHAFRKTDQAPDVALPRSRTGRAW
ncbi:SLOG family protein [Novosphingobium sp. BL-52-GroH]|uniref:SLOG family protein n=1 Tax=Novosphingobium sp. BL-52-GroH TaxID=3349877 RepID=UPI0038505D20